MNWNPFSRAVQDNPYPYYAWMRDHAPVYHNYELGIWALSRFEDVKAAILDAPRVSSQLRSFAGGGRRFYPQFLFTDPPRSTQLRAVVSKHFTPRASALLEPRMREYARSYLGPILEARGGDIIADFAARLPLDIICDLLGIPPEDRADVRQWSDDYLARDDGDPLPPPAAHAAAEAFAEYFRRARAEREKRPRNDVLSVMARAALPGEGKLSDDDYVGNATMLAIAGNETTTKLIASAVLELWRHPDQRAWLAANPQGIPNAVEETLRYEAPSQWQNRRAARDFTLHGVTVPKDAFVALVTGAACRDPRRYPDPDRYDVRRADVEHLSLGWGQHLCLGKSLARLETKVALEEILRAFPKYRVHEDGLKRVYVTNVAGYCKMPISF
jgi:cytochrome P450